MSPFRLLQLRWLAGFAPHYPGWVGRMFDIFQLNVKERLSVASPLSILYIPAVVNVNQSRSCLGTTRWLPRIELHSLF